MKATVALIIGVLFVALGSQPALAQKRALAGQQITADQLPAPVTAALDKSYPKATIVSVSKITRGTETRYQISLKVKPDAEPISVLASADGTLNANRAALRTLPPTPIKGQKRGASPDSQPTPMNINDLPKEVVKAIKEAYPKDTILQAFRLSTPLPTFEVLLDDVSSLQPLKVTITADGRIQKR